MPDPAPLPKNLLDLPPQALESLMAQMIDSQLTAGDGPHDAKVPAMRRAGDPVPPVPPVPPVVSVAHVEPASAPAGSHPSHASVRAERFGAFVRAWRRIFGDSRPVRAVDEPLRLGLDPKQTER